MSLYNYINQFDSQKNAFKHCIEAALHHKKEADLFLVLSKYNGEKGCVDQAFREVLSHLVAEDPDGPMEPILSLSVQCAEKGLCSIHLPVTLLSDVFDSLTLDRCEQLFSWVEDRVSFWQKDFFFNNCKNRILRTCNDLLRRLSRSQNTVFCGRTLVFLAKIFPLSERSGLNINSEFNVENLTLFSSQQLFPSSTQDDEEAETVMVTDQVMEEGEMDDSRFTVDYNLYRKFWSLQEFFRQPNTCYSRPSWKQFTSYSQEVLSALSSYRLEDRASSSMRTLSSSSSNCYFAKYLTNQKLLELELSDSNFRRYVLIQFLILFQYLQATVKSRHESLNLTEEQSNWIKETRAKIYQLLEATPPHGEPFAKNVERILKREEYWNNWKNEGCPSFKNLQTQTETQPAKKKPRLGDLIKNAEANNEVIIGTPELNYLWNLEPNNWKACKAESRNYIPTLDSYFKIAIEQADPASGIEERYKAINDINYGWRALRLLALRSPVFFLPAVSSSGGSAPKTLARYLEITVEKLARELPVSSTGIEETTATVDSEEESDADDLTASADSELPPGSLNTSIGGGSDTISTIAANNPLSSRSALSHLARLVDSKWRLLAERLGFEEDEIQYMTPAVEDDDGESQEQAARHMLLVWLEQQPESEVVRTLAKLRAALSHCNLGTALEFVDSLTQHV